MPRKLPPDMELIKKFRQGFTDRKLAEEYGVTVAAVNKARLRLVGPKKPITNKVNEGLSTRWRIIEESGGIKHQGGGQIRDLRVFLRRQLGDDTLSAAQLAKAREFESRIRRNDVVVEYDPEKRLPWSYRPRRPEDGRLVVDWPSDLPYPSEEFRQALTLPEVQDEEEATDDE